jgi:hypothetical protein
VKFIRNHIRLCSTAFFLFTTFSITSTAPLLAQTENSSQVSSSLAPTEDGPSADSGDTLNVVDTGMAMPDESMRRTPTRDLWRHPGIGVQVGINGVGIDFAEPLGQHFNARIGGEYLKYTGNFTSDGAQIAANIRVGGGKFALDYFPFHNGFRISPQVRFGILTNLAGTVVVPPGESISLSGGDYVSSTANPLHGDATVTTRRVAPGISIGYGNLSPRHGEHWSFPVEFGFYYIGQPHLQVHFSGTACDPSQPPAVGCEDVTQDADFQHDLAAFIARNNHNLSYASFFPIASFGVGYRF